MPSNIAPNDVVPMLRSIRYGRTPSLASIAKRAGLSRSMLYEIINTGHASARLTMALSEALQNVQNEGYHIPRSTGF